MAASAWLLAAAVVAAAEEAPPRVVIPETLYLEFRSGIAPRESCADDASAAERRAALARAAAPVRVAYADEVDLVGHLEAREGINLTVLGRRVETDLAELAGGGRDSLVPGALVRIIGQGAQSGLVRASKVEILSPPDPEAAARLNREVAKFKDKFWKKARRLDDPDLNAYLQGIVRRLAPAHVPASDRPFEVSIVMDPDLNAFALPDGNIVVHTGLIARMENEAQLATVLGHEMAHITQRHTDRAMKRDLETTLLSWGSMLAALALGVGGKGDAAQGVQLMSSAVLSGWSRAHEDEADIVGLRYTWLAGYDVRQAPEVWRTFQLLYGDMTREQNFFYGSHSTGRDREHNLGHEIWKSYEPSGMVGGELGRERYQTTTASAVRENALLDLARGNLPWAEWGIAKAMAAAPDDARNLVALGRITLRTGASDALESAIVDFRRATELDAELAEAWRELGLALRRAGDRLGGNAALGRYLELAPDASDAASIRRTLGRT